MSTHIAEDKPNNQVKMSNVSGASLPPGHLKCNILKGKLFERNYKLNNPMIPARVEEELGANAKLTNQMFVPGAFSSGPSSINNVESGPDSLNATYISVVSLKLVFFAKYPLVNSCCFICFVHEGW